MSWPEILIRIGVAVLVGGAIGVEREYKNRPAGMRTHVLVCLGACIIAMLEGLLRAEELGSNVTITLGRLSAQVVSGIGFLGAGTIFMAQKKIAGLTTAASLWNVACLGLLIGFGYYWVAAACCALVLLVLLLLQRLVRVNAIKRVEVRFVHRAETLGYINSFFSKNGIKVLDMDFHIESVGDQKKNESNIYTNLYTLHLPSKVKYADVVNELSEFPNIHMVRTRNT